MFQKYTLQILMQRFIIVVVSDKLLVAPDNKMPEKKEQSGKKLDDIVAKARSDSEKRGHGYRQQALKMYPWICGRCTREFSRINLQELTVHHRNHDHDYNPPDGSNWELLCMYCHDNEHQRQTEALANKGVALDGAKAPSAKFNPFADLKSMMDKNKEKQGS